MRQQEQCRLIFLHIVNVVMKGTQMLRNGSLGLISKIYSSQSEG